MSSFVGGILFLRTRREGKKNENSYLNKPVASFCERATACVFETLKLWKRLQLSVKLVTVVAVFCKNKQLMIMLLTAAVIPSTCLPL